MMGDSDLRVKEVIVDSRINKVLAMRTDSVPMLEALDAISEFYVSNTIDSRRLLRQDLELQNVNLAKKFLGEFDLVKAKICDVEDLSNRLQNDCCALAAKMKNADENMKSFMEKASHLETRRNFFSQQSAEILAFLSRFQLSNEEIDLLYNADLNNSRSANLFFEALQRLKNAYADCKAMVEKHCYSVGFELLEVLGQHQDTAYQHLFDWVKNKCNSLAETGASDDYDTNRKLQTAIRFLKKLPIYFSQCQDLLVNSRRTQLVQRFISALTQGEGGGVSGSSSSSGSNSAISSSSGSNKSLRALDLHSHDPLKYVGGMLSWTHQAMASELEFLEAIFEDSMDRSDGGASAAAAASKAHDSSDAGSSSGNLTLNVADGDVLAAAASKAEGGGGGGAGGLSIPELLAHCLQGLGRPLRVRIIQTLETKAVLSTLYGLTDLLSFYEATFARILAVENAVHSAVKGCLQECRRSFLSTLARQQDSLTKSVVSSTVDLKASHVTRECTSQIHELYAVFNGAMSRALLERTLLTSGDASGSPMTATAAGAGGSDKNPFHIETVLESIVQPLLTSCRLGGQSLPEAELAIYMLNNISVIQSEIVEGTKSKSSSLLSSETENDASSGSGVSPWKELLSTESATWIDILVKEEVTRTLKRSDLDKLLEIIELLPQGLVASEQIGLSQDRVSTIVRAFYASLFSTFAPQFERLQDPALRETIRVKIAQKMYAAHKMIHDFVSLDSNGYDKSILVHSVTEVGVLLGYDAGASGDDV